MDQTTRIGTVLRTAREQRQLSLESVARSTMIRRDYLELIDADELERLPAGAYAKGFIRAYASHLGLDPAPFVEGYEAQCGNPAPELSSVVRQPVRVPHAAQTRTWRMAAAAGVLVVVLGAIGVLRSGEDGPTSAQPSAAEFAASVSSLEDAAIEPPGNPAGAVVRIDVVGTEAWVEGAPDGTVEFAGVLRSGERKWFRGQDSVRLVLGNPSAVKLRVNGQDVGTPTGKRFQATITPTTRGMPVSQVETTAGG